MKSQAWNFHGFDISSINNCVVGMECNRIKVYGTSYWFGYAFADANLTKLIDYETIQFSIRSRSTGKMKVGLADNNKKKTWFEL